jgi:hypothetical protein
VYPGRGQRGKGAEGKRGRGEEGKRSGGEKGKRGRGEKGKRGKGAEGKRGRGRCVCHLALLFPFSLFFSAGLNSPNRWEV